MRRLIAAVLVAAACASPGMPPGGPEDSAAPKIVRIVPDSGRTGTRPREVIFRFDEVVSERPAAGATLSALFYISPRHGSVDVDWNREEIAVRPSKGFRANTMYTITLLPGLADLRGNIRNTGARTFFSTGGAIPTSRLSGTVWDWGAGRTARGALVEAIALPDSLTYMTIADSAGRFAFDHLPRGRFLVRGVVDDNNNRGLDPRETWDTLTVALSDSLRADILAFPHDTIAPVIESIAMEDSVRARVTFDRALDPARLPGPSQFALRAADSSVVTILSATAPADSAVAPAPPKPRPPREIVLTFGAPLRASATYRLSTTGVRGLLGASSASTRAFTTPAPKPPPKPAPAAQPRDSLKK